MTRVVPRVLDDPDVVTLARPKVKSAPDAFADVNGARNILCARGGVAAPRLVGVAGPRDNAMQMVEAALRQRFPDSVHFVYLQEPGEVTEWAQQAHAPAGRRLRARSLHAQAAIHSVENATAALSLAGLPAASQPSQSDREDGPWLFFFNFLGIAAAHRRIRKSRRLWLESLRNLQAAWPETPHIVVADEVQQRSLIRTALATGADEVLDRGDVAIPELVIRRVRSGLANVWVDLRSSADEPLDAAVMGPEAPVLRDTETAGERGNQRALAAAAADLAPAKEAKDADQRGNIPTVSRGRPLNDTERIAAMENARRVAESLPTPHERGEPVADILGITAPSLRAESGRFDAIRIANRLGVSLTKFAELMPISRQAISENPDSPKLQRALDPFAIALGTLDMILPEDDVGAWLCTPRERLNMRTPLEAMLAGDADRVAHLLTTAIYNGGVGG